MNKKIKLTKRQKEILNLVAEGKSDREIAERLNVTWNTIRSHLRFINATTNVDNRCQLITWGFRNGILK